MNQVIQQAYVRERPELSYAQPTDPWFTRGFIRSVEVLFGRRRVEQLYWHLKDTNVPPAEFFTAALEILRIDVHWNVDQLAHIPTHGPLVFVANHPFGVVDGLILCDLALRIRQDFRILIHAMLCQDRELSQYFLPIDFQPGKAAVRNNIESKRVALASLAANVPILIFPSGMVSTATKMGFGSVTDAPWTTFAAKLIMESRATVVPVHFFGRNSRKFHVVSHIAEPLRMGLLVHEALNKVGARVSVAIGQPLVYEQLERFGTRQALTEYLYSVVQQLGGIRARYE